MTKLYQTRPFWYSEVNRFWFWNTCYITFRGTAIKTFSGTKHDLAELIVMLNDAYEIGFYTGRK